MKTRSGKLLNGTNPSSRKRKNDQNQPKQKKAKTDIASPADWGLLPTLVIQKIYSHLKSKESDKWNWIVELVKLENQMSVNRHWRSVIHVQRHRTHLTLNSIDKNTERSVKLTNFLTGVKDEGLTKLQHLHLHNMNSHIGQLQQLFHLEPFQLDSLVISADDLSTIKSYQNIKLNDFVGYSSSPDMVGHCQNLKSFTAKGVQLTQYQFSMFFGLKSLTKLVLQIPPRPATESQSLAIIPTEDHLLNIQRLTSLTHLDVECIRTPTWKDHFTRYGKPWVKYCHLSPNIQFLRLQFVDLWGSSVEDNGPWASAEAPLQFMQNLKYLSLETFTIIHNRVILEKLMSQAPLNYVRIDDSVSDILGRKLAIPFAL